MRNYRSTPHPATGKTPSNLLFQRDRTCRLPAFRKAKFDLNIKNVAQKDKEYKSKSKKYADKKRKAQFDDLEMGQIVYRKQKRTNKFMTSFSPDEMIVVGIKGSMITAKNSETGWETTRDRSFFIKKKGEDSVTEPEFDNSETLHSNETVERNEMVKESEEMEKEEEKAIEEVLQEENKRRVLPKRNIKPIERLGIDV